MKLSCDRFLGERMDYDLIQVFTTGSRVRSANMYKSARGFARVRAQRCAQAARCFTHARTRRLKLAARSLHRTPMYHQEALHVTATRAEVLEIESRSPVLSAFYGRKLDASGKVHAVECVHARVSPRASGACVHVEICICTLVYVWCHSCIFAFAKTRAHANTH